MPTAAQFNSARAIAKASGFSSKTVHRRAKSEHWPSRKIANRLEYIAPRALLGAHQPRQEAALVAFPPPIPAEEGYRLRRAWLRFAALEELRRLTDGGMPIERALAEVARGHSFSVSPSSLRAWADGYAQHGLEGLQEHKLGRVGRKPSQARRRTNPSHAA
jgi:hypothetical protein